jgi:hypothetical protein
VGALLMWSNAGRISSSSSSNGSSGAGGGGGGAPMTSGSDWSSCVTIPLCHDFCVSQFRCDFFVWKHLLLERCFAFRFVGRPKGLVVVATCCLATGIAFAFGFGLSLIESLGFNLSRNDRGRTRHCLPQLHLPETNADGERNGT